LGLFPSFFKIFSRNSKQFTKRSAIIRNVYSVFSKSNKIKIKQKQNKRERFFRSLYILRILKFACKAFLLYAKFY